MKRKHRWQKRSFWGICLIGLGVVLLLYALFGMQGKDIIPLLKKSNALPTEKVNPEKPMVALTFDDGPYAPATCRILDALQKVNGKATFFIVGSRVKGREDTILKIQNSGSEIGNHTFDHVTLRGLCDADLKKEIAKGDAAIFEVTKQAPTLLRPPGGAYGENLKHIDARPIVLWSIDTMDWSHQNADITVEKVLSEVQDGDIVLMHDLFLPTAQAVERMVPELTKRGFQFVTVSELLQYRQNVSVLFPRDTA